MGTVKVTNLEPISGGGTLTVGASGDTITFPAGVTVTNNGTQTGFGGTNTPRFLARKTSDQSIVSAVPTKVTFDVEHYDTGVFDLANNKFTVPSEEAGIYMFYTAIRNNFNGASVGTYSAGNLYLNGTRILLNTLDWRNSYGGYSNSLTTSVALNLSVGDYVEVYADIGVTSGTPAVTGDASEYRTYFGGYKLIT